MWKSGILFVCQSCWLRRREGAAGGGSGESVPAGRWGRWGRWGRLRRGVLHPLLSHSSPLVRSGACLFSPRVLVPPLRPSPPLPQGSVAESQPRPGVGPAGDRRPGARPLRASRAAPEQLTFCFRVSLTAFASPKSTSSSNQGSKAKGTDRHFTWSMHVILT